MFLVAEKFGKFCAKLGDFAINLALLRPNNRGYCLIIGVIASGRL